RLGLLEAIGAEALGGGVHRGGVGGNRRATAGGDRRTVLAAQVPERRPNDPEQEQVQHDQEGELESDGDRLEDGHRHSSSKRSSVVPSSIRSPGSSGVGSSTRRPLSLVPLVEPRSTTAQP